MELIEGAAGAGAGRISARFVCRRRRSTQPPATSSSDSNSTCNHRSWSCCATSICQRLYEILTARWTNTWLSTVFVQPLNA